MGAATGFSSDLEARTHGIANLAQAAAFVWREFPVPVIAAVHGVAFGGEFQLALGADVRSSRLTRSFPFSRSSGASCPTWAASR